MSAPWPAAFAIALAALSVGGCSLLNWDRRSDVAYLTLLNDRGTFDDKAYGAALNARYPSGTPLKSLLDYVARSKGKCNERSPEQLWCEIPTRGGFCWAQLIGLDIGVMKEVVTDIKVHVGGLGC